MRVLTVQSLICTYACFVAVQFDREKTPERIVHARGITAKGTFEVCPSKFRNMKEVVETYGKHLQNATSWASISG